MLAELTSQLQDAGLGGENRSSRRSVIAAQTFPLSRRSLSFNLN